MQLKIINPQDASEMLHFFF